jgi:hypothetical protein
LQTQVANGSLMSVIFLFFQAIKIGASLWLTALAGWWILAKLSFLQKKNFGGFWGIVRSLRNRTNVWGSRACSKTHQRQFGAEIF